MLFFLKKKKEKTLARKSSKVFFLPRAGPASLFSLLPFLFSKISLGQTWKHKRKEKQSLRNLVFFVSKKTQNLDVKGAELARELDLRGRLVVSDAPRVRVGRGAPGVDALGDGPVLGVQVLRLARRQEAVDVADLDLVLGLERREEGQGLLLARELEEVGARPHDRGASRGHLEGDLGARVLPGEDVELLDLLELSVGTWSGSGGRKGKEKG